MNSRPLTPVLLDPDANVPLTPNHLLLLRGNASDFSNQFSESDTYSSRRWRQEQYLAQELWRRCTVEYLHMLQLRPKWLNEHENFELNDIVLLHNDNAARRSGPLGKVVEVFPDQKNRVRQVLVKTQFSVLRRPITKLYRILNARNHDVD